MKDVRVFGDAISGALIESLPDAVVIVNMAGSIVLVNAQTEALFGYKREEMVDHPIEMLVPEAVRERIACTGTSSPGGPGRARWASGWNCSGAEEMAATSRLRLASVSSCMAVRRT